MTKKKETKKPYILVESDFSPIHTHIYVVGKNGKKTEIPGVTSAKWEATAGKVCTLDLKVLAHVNLKVEEPNTKKEEISVDKVEKPYYNSSWLGQFENSEPVKIVAEEDRSQDYETDSITVFELENGKFAVVIESGCSCYDSSSDAAIEVHATYEEAMKSFNDWKGN